jgi:hypothetical protein
VDDLRAIDQNVANRYLEHVVVVKRSPNRALHQALLDHLLDATGKQVEDDGVKYHLEELGGYSAASCRGVLTFRCRVSPFI